MYPQSLAYICPNTALCRCRDGPQARRRIFVSQLLELALLPTRMTLHPSAPELTPGVHHIFISSLQPRRKRSFFRSLFSVRNCRKTRTLLVTWTQVADRLVLSQETSLIDILLLQTYMDETFTCEAFCV